MTGTVTATSFSGDGSNLTGVNAISVYDTFQNNLVDVTRPLNTGSGSDRHILLTLTIQIIKESVLLFGHKVVVYFPVLLLVFQVVSSKNSCCK